MLKNLQLRVDASELVRCLDRINVAIRTLHPDCSPFVFRDISKMLESQTLVVVKRVNVQDETGCSSIIALLPSYSMVTLMLEAEQTFADALSKTNVKNTSEGGNASM